MERWLENYNDTLDAQNTVKIQLGNVKGLNLERVPYITRPLYYSSFCRNTSELDISWRLQNIKEIAKDIFDTLDAQKYG